MIGQTLGHYKILDLLGAGGMGEVFLAKDTTLDREVALKVLPAELAQSRERLERFQREAKTLAVLDHPNIVTIHTVEESGGVHFLTMQLVDGKRLSDLIPKGGMTLEHIFEIAIPLADALAAAHEKSVIHRDLKPANIMLSDDGRVKVLDFGLAKLRQAAQAPVATQLPTEPLTEEGRILGTMPYMSPEQLEGKDLDARTDVFSLGVILYEMATGERPFKGDSSASLISAIMTKTPREVDSLRAEIPHHLARIIRRCLEKEPKRRYQAASDVRNELEDLHREISTDRGAVEVQRERRGKTGITVALAAAALVVVIGIWVLWKGQDKFPTETPSTLQEVRLTSNPDDRPAFGYLSPDGTLLAYKDPLGAYVLDIEAGEHRQIAEGEVGVPTWHPDGRSLLIRKMGDDLRPAIWRISLLSGDHTKIQDDAHKGHYSPDGTTIGFLGDPANEIWITDSRGDSRETILKTTETFIDRNLTWSPSGLRLAYIQTDVSMSSAIMTMSLSDRNPQELLASDRLRSPVGAGALVWLENGELLYVLMDEAWSDSSGSSLWSIPMDEETGKPLGRSRKIRSWPEFQGNILSGSKDGTRLAVGKLQNQQDSYIGELSDIGSAVGELRKLTSLGSRTIGGEWLSADELVFWSDRFGKSQVYRRKLESDAVLEPLAEVHEEWNFFALAPEGAWILWDYPLKDENGEIVGAEVMRRAFAGGSAESVYTTQGDESDISYLFLQCSESSAANCVLSERIGEELVFFLFDPMEGKGREYGRLNLEGIYRFPAWSLSDDGRKLAMPFTCTSIALYDFDLQEQLEVEVSGLRCLQYLDWWRGESALIGSGLTGENQRYVMGLLQLDGSFTPLWKTSSTWLSVNDTSPDGRFVSATGVAFRNEIWLLCEDCPGS